MISNYRRKGGGNGVFQHRVPLRRVHDGIYDGDANKTTPRNKMVIPFSRQHSISGYSTKERVERDIGRKRAKDPLQEDKRYLRKNLTFGGNRDLITEKIMAGK